MSVSTHLSSIGGTSANSRSSKRKRANGARYLGPRDKLFDDVILGAGLHIQFEPLHEVSSSQGPPADTPNESGLTSSVFLEMDDIQAEHISLQLSIYQQSKYDETTLQLLVTKWIAPFDEFVNEPAPQGIASLCRHKLKILKHLIEPPEVESDGYFYDFNIEPDITYMVSLTLFTEAVRNEIRTPHLNWRADTAGCCPYLTFELKCAKKLGKDSDALRQVTAASVVWLSQRRRLRYKIGSGNLSDLRHYSIIINSLDYQIWIAQFHGDDDLGQASGGSGTREGGDDTRGGLVMRMLDKGSFDRVDDVKKYARWSNAIHRWGLGPNALSFKEDVEKAKTLWDSAHSHS